MRREVEVYGAWSDPASDLKGWTSGSGLLVTGRLVLTAAHVVSRLGQPFHIVQIRPSTGELVAARVIWHGGRVDAALIEIVDEQWISPTWRHRVRWGRLVTTRVGQACEAVGFPRVVATPQLRDSHHAVGVLNPGALVKSGLYAVEVTNPPDPTDASGSQWAGMSGAALLAGDAVVGVVTTDPAGFNSRRLTAVPISMIARDTRFADLVDQHTGRRLNIEPVELLRLAEPIDPPTSPADLLRASAATVPFRHRPELDQLLRWCAAEAWSGIRLVAGPGGQGKTRLAHQLVNLLADRGWATLILGEQASAADIAILADLTIPALVVLDYAEGRVAQLDPLIAALNRAEAKVRLLLLARTGGAWRTDRVAPSAHLDVLAGDIVVALQPVEQAVAGRRQAWRDAVSALATRLSELDVYRHLPWPDLERSLPVPALEGDRYRTILAVQMHALASLLDAGNEPQIAHRDSSAVPVGTERTAQSILLDHEARYWARVAEQFQIKLAPSTRRHLVTAATLWGAATHADTHHILKAHLGHDTDRDTTIQVGDWLATLYHDNDHYWSGLQPDPLGEYLVGTVITADDDFDIRESARRASPAQLERALTVLGRAHPHHPTLTSTVADLLREAGVAGARAAITIAPRLEEPQPVVEALNQTISTAELDTMIQISESLPRYSTVLGPTSLSLTERIVESHRELVTTNRDTYLPNLATALHQLAARLAASGRQADALAAAQEAVDLRRELVDMAREMHIADLARSMISLAVRLAESGGISEGRDASKEAVALLRELTASKRDTYLSALAQALNVFANRLAESGQPAEALTRGFHPGSPSRACRTAGGCR